MALTTLPVVGTSDPSLPSAVNGVLDGMDISENSRTQYRRELRFFFGWLGGSALHPNVLLDFKKHLKACSDLSPGTQAKYLSVARSFLRELYRRQLLPVDVTANVKGIRAARTHKRSALTDDEVRRVFDYLDSDAPDPRAKVIIGLMYFQGLRRIEIARLRVEDFDRHGATLAVQGKGQDDREKVDLHPRAVALLSEHVTRNAIKSGPLLPSPKCPGKPLSSSAIWRIAMEGVHRKLGLADRNLHSYRKTFVTRLIQTGMTLLEVQGYSRHRSVEMLQVYYQRLEKQKTLPVYYRAF
jgi:integrase